VNNNYKYTKSSRHGYGYESVEFTLDSQYTTCIVNVDMLLCGIKSHSCTNGENYILDCETIIEILQSVREARNSVKYSKKLKTLSGWRESGLNLSDYLAVGDEVDEALVEEQMNCVPPHRHRSDYLQVGEPYCDAYDENFNCSTAYTTFRKKTDNNRSCWIYAGHCFTGEVTDQAGERDLPQSMIRKVTEDMKRGDDVDA
jgi:hypothetical protein